MIAIDLAETYTHIRDVGETGTPPPTEGPGPTTTPDEGPTSTSQPPDPFVIIHYLWTVGVIVTIIIHQSQLLKSS